MSIRTININNYPQLFNVSLQNKHKYGEVNTDFKLASQILQLIPSHKFSNPKFFRFTIIKFKIMINR